MPEARDLVVLIGADAREFLRTMDRIDDEFRDFDRAAEQAGREAREFGRDLDRTEREIREMDRATNSLSRALGQAGLVAAAALAAREVAQLGAQAVRSAIGFNSMVQQVSIGFETMLGDAEKANRFISEIQAFAARTPFEFEGLVEASQRLLAMGFAAEEVLPTMTAVGDAVAALGRGREGIDRVTLALALMRAKGAPAAQEMLQLAQAGIPAWEILAEKIGVDIPTAMKMVEQKAIDAEATIAALVEGMTERFGGQMERQASTLAGMWSTVTDEVRVSSSQGIRPFFAELEDGLSQVLNDMPMFSQAIENAFAGLAAVMSPALDIIIDIATFIADIVASMGDLEDQLDRISRSVDETRLTSQLEELRERRSGIVSDPDFEAQMALHQRFQGSPFFAGTPLTGELEAIDAQIVAIEKRLAELSAAEERGREPIQRTREPGRDLGASVAAASKLITDSLAEGITRGLEEQLRRERLFTSRNVILFEAAAMGSGEDRRLARFGPEIRGLEEEIKLLDEAISEIGQTASALTDRPRTLGVAGNEPVLAEVAALQTLQDELLAQREVTLAQIEILREEEKLLRQRPAEPSPEAVTPRDPGRPSPRITRDEAVLAEIAKQFALLEARAGAGLVSIEDALFGLHDLRSQLIDLTTAGGGLANASEEQLQVYIAITRAIENFVASAERAPDVIAEILADLERRLGVGMVVEREISRATGANFDPLAFEADAIQQAIREMVSATGEIPEEAEPLLERLRELTDESEALAVREAALSAAFESLKARLDEIHPALGGLVDAIQFDASGMFVGFDMASLAAQGVAFALETLINVFDRGSAAIEARIAQVPDPGEDALSISQRFADFEDMQRNIAERERELRHLEKQQQIIDERAAGGLAGGAAVGAAIGSIIPAIGSIIPGIGTLFGAIIGGIIGGAAQERAAEESLGPEISQTEEEIRRLEDAIRGARVELIEALGIAADRFASGIERAIDQASIVGILDDPEAFAAFGSNLQDTLDDIIRGAVIKGFVSEVLAGDIAALTELGLAAARGEEFVGMPRQGTPDAPFVPLDLVRTPIGEALEMIGAEIEEKSITIFDVLESMGLLAETTDRLNREFEQLLNVPGGVRVEQFRFDAAIPEFHTGGVMPHDGLASLRRGELVITPEQQRGMGGGMIVINVNGAQDPRAVAREVMRQLRAQNARRNGNPSLAAPPLLTGR